MPILKTVRYMMHSAVPTYTKLVPLIVFLYAVSPIDFMPAAVLGLLGVVDDAGVAIVGLNWFVNNSSRYAVIQ